MTFIEDAGKLWHRLWSVRLALLAALFSTGQLCIGYYAEGQSKTVIMGAAVFSLGSSLASAFSRVVKQPKLRGTVEQ